MLRQQVVIPAIDTKVVPRILCHDGCVQLHKTTLCRFYPLCAGIESNTFHAASRVTFGLRKEQVVVEMKEQQSLHHQIART